MVKTVIIADDHPFTVEGMESVIQGFSTLKVVGTATNGIEAIALTKRLQPDCAILDLSMPGANGLEVFQEAKQYSPHTRFIIVTGISAATLFKQLYDAGVDGIFVKNTPPDVISAGIISVSEGQRIISDEAMKAIESVRTLENLSKRELDVLKALSRGLTNKKIAEELGVSPKTIDNHRTNLLKKMEVNSTAALLMAAMRNGLIDI